MKNKKGFTLVELLAVIAILAILVLIALPNVVKMFNEAKKSSFLTEAQTIYKETTKKYISESMKGNKLSTISSKDDSKLDMTGEDLDYCVILDSQGKVEKLAVGNSSYYIMLRDVKDINSITKEDVNEGTLNNMKCDASAFRVKLSCDYDGKLTNGATYVNGQYTYTYNGSTGWAVKLTDKNSTDPVTSSICTTINNKPIVSARYMFEYSKATSIDLSTFDISNVTNMYGMFRKTNATTLDVSHFDTSNAINMYGMFYDSEATIIEGLENFDTSNVTNMSYMFSGSKATTLDLSSFNTSNVTNMGGYVF